MASAVAAGEPAKGKPHPKSRCPLTPEDKAAMFRVATPPIQAGLPPPEQPIALMMCGTAGAGKSTLRKQIFEYNGVKEGEYILADPDHLLPEIAGWKAGNHFCRPEATYFLNDELLPALVETRHHIVYDTTCRILSNTMNAAQLFKKAGYYVIFAMVWVDLPKAIQRTKIREAATGRKIPAEAVREIYEKLQGIGARYMEVPEFDEVLLLDNTRAKPILRYYREAGVVKVCKKGDAAFYFNLRPFCNPVSRGGSTRRRGRGSRRQQRSKRHHRTKKSLK